MNIEQIQTNLDLMLLNPKAKGFLTHLIKNYMPLSNVVQVVKKPRGEFKCVLTKEQLISQEEILDAVQSEEFKADFFNFSKSMFDEKSDRTTPMANLLSERKLAVTGKDTTSFMAYATFNEFASWVFNKLAMGEKHVTWLLKANYKDKVQPFKEPFKRVQMEGVETVGKAATYTMGEVSGLQALKERLISYEADTLI